MAVKSQPLSLRLSESSYAFVKDEAERTGRSRSGVVEALAEEGLRMRLFPGIAFRGESPRRPWVTGTGLDVWQIIEALRDFGSIEALVAGSDIAERAVRLAAAYHERNPEESEAMIARNERPLSELRERYPTFDVVGLDA